MIWQAAVWECPQAEDTGIALAYGTEPRAETIAALRGDHWLHAHPEQAAPLREAIRRRMRDAFYTDTDAWKQRIVEQADEAARQALRGLCG